MGLRLRFFQECQICETFRFCQTICKGGLLCESFPGLFWVFCESFFLKICEFPDLWD